MNKQCTCLIPVYNEGRRLIPTLTLLEQVSSIDRFLLVDDGSTDQAMAKVKRLFPEVKIIRLPKNQGKTAAVVAGLNRIHTSYIFLADADLRNIKPEEFDSGIKSFKRKSLAMLLFRRIKDFSHVYTGERIIRTALLKKALAQKQRPYGYQLEAAINQYCLDRNLKVCWIPITAQNTYKVQKMGFIGWLFDLKTIGEIVSLIGVKNYYHQLFFFAKQLTPSKAL